MCQRFEFRWSVFVDLSIAVSGSQGTPAPGRGRGRSVARGITIRTPGARAGEKVAVHVFCTIRGAWGGASGGGPRDAEMPLVGQRRPALPRTRSAVPSALGGLTSGFGMGPGVPPLPWSLTNKGHSASGARRRALRAAQRDVGAPSGTLRRSEDEEKSSAD